MGSEEPPKDTATVWSQFTSTVCTRSFSSPEAVGYESLISGAVCSVVAPLVQEILTGSLVLDVGCGGGRLAAVLNGRSGCCVVGVDPSMAQMRRVSRRGCAVPTMALAGALPFGQEVFDAVVSSCALKHWPDPAAGLRECARVTKPGGQVIIIEIDGDSTSAQLRAFARRTRIPPGLREAYVRFAMTTVVGVAPSLATLGGLVGAVYPAPVITKVEGLPFAVAAAVRPAA